MGPTFVASGVMTGPYKIEHAAVGVSCLVTNKTPGGSYRGYGQPEGVFALERLIDTAAKEIGADPIEMRRRVPRGVQDSKIYGESAPVIDEYPRSSGRSRSKSRRAASAPA